jgi:hypothetical protein
MIGAIMRTQLRLLVRGWSFWLMVVSAIGLTVYTTRGGNQVTLNSISMELVFMFFLLGHMLLTTAAAHRERGDRVEELIAALPYRTTAWIFGRFLVQYLVWLILSALLWGTGAVMVLRAGHGLDPRPLVMSWVVIAPVTLIFTTAISQAIGYFMNGVAAFFVSAGIWFGAPLMMIFLAKNRGPVPVPLFEYFASGRAFPLSSLGYFPNGLQLGLNRLFIFGLGAILITLVLWQLTRRRGLATRGMILALVACATLTGVAGASAQWDWSGRYGAYNRELATLSYLPMESKLAPSPLRTDRYDLLLKLEPATHRMAVTGSFDITNTGSTPMAQIELTLRSNFTVMAVGDGVGAVRQGDGLIILQSLATNETKHLTLAWSGEVWQWRMNNGPKLAAHVATESILLPATYVWYPFPGKQTLSYNVPYCSAKCIPHIQDAAVAHAAASFQVRVVGTDLHILTNADHPATGLALIGTQYQPNQVNGVKVAVSDLQQESARYLTQAIVEHAKAYDDVLPRVGHPFTLVELPDSFYFGTEFGSSQDDVAAPDMALLQTTALSRQPVVSALVYIQRVRDFWWPLERLSVVDQFLFDGFILYTEGRQGQDVHAMSQGEHDVYAILKEVETNKGLPTVTRILQAMHAKLDEGGAPTAAEFKALVMQEAGDLPKVVELLAKLPSVKP